MEVIGPSGVQLYLYILYCICTGNINSCGICKDRITGLLDSLSDYFQIDVHSATCRSLKEFQQIFQSTIFVKFVWMCGSWFSTFPCSHRQQLLRENLNWFLFFFFFTIEGSWALLNYSSFLLTCPLCKTCMLFQESWLFGWPWFGIIIAHLITM